MKKAKILVVDDEEDICEILKYNLENEGYEVNVAHSAEDAMKLKIDKYALIVLDVMMGKMSGFKMAEKIRKEKLLNIPIIFLTAKDTENDTLTGFILGADDYIVKPFSIRQVIARVKAVLNRTAGTAKAEEKLSFKGLEIDFISKKILVNKKEVCFTKKEFDILVLLAENQGRVFSREEIMDNVWGGDVIVGERTIDVNITRIRKKLGPYQEALINRFGYGYCFDFNNLK